MSPAIQHMILCTIILVLAYQFLYLIEYFYKKKYGKSFLECKALEGGEDGNRDED